MVAMYESGQTLQEIGAVFGLSRQRIYQILFQYGATQSLGRQGGAKLRILRRRQQTKELVIAAKAMGCACGETDPRCLDFHHKDPTQKLFHIPKAAKIGYSVEKIQDELAKCDVICSNCHRKLHRLDPNYGHHTPRVC